MFKLNKPLVIRTSEGNKEVTELDISQEKLTADVLIRAEREFLANSGLYPMTGMEDSKDYIAHIVAKMCSYKYDDIIQMNGVDFIRISKEVRGFFGKSGFQEILEKLSEESLGLSVKKSETT